MNLTTEYKIQKHTDSITDVVFARTAERMFLCLR